MLDLDLELRQGSFSLQGRLTLGQPVSGLFGPSGCGKSTLLRAIAGLARPQTGYIKLDGVPLFDAKQRLDLPPHRRRVGLVFQDSQLFPHFSVEHNLRYGFRLLPPGTGACIALRATDVALARHLIADITIQNQVPGRILGLRRVADRVLVEVDVGAPILAEITVKAVQDLGLREGDTVYCLFKARAWHYLGAT